MKTAAVAVAPRPAGAGDTGLVPSSTSHSGLSVSRTDSRLKGMKKTVMNSTRCFRDALSAAGARFRTVMVTLTYREVGDWEPKHLSRFMGAVREYLRRRDLAVRYVYVAELQERGAVHYHVLFFLPRGVTLPKPDKRGWWPHGSTRIEWVRKAVGYMLKYASKLQSKTGTFPKGLRICGAGGLDADGRRECRWWKLPGYVQELWSVGDDAARCVGGGFVSRESGEWVRARYKFAGVRGDTVRLIDLWAEA
jgi:hypothetical protein